jgi:hypothetical protein
MQVQQSVSRPSSTAVLAEIATRFIGCVASGR